MGSGERKESGEKFDARDKLILETIKRFDGYITATNSKVAMIISYCIAYLAGLMLRLNVFDATGLPLWAAVAVFSVAALSASITAWTTKYAFSALAPRTPSGRADHEAPSIFFFGDVASYAGGRDGYVKRVRDITQSELEVDLANQAHVLAGIAKAKYDDIGMAVKWLVRGQVPSLVLTVFLLIIAKMWR